MIEIIAAFSENRAIGFQNKLPWHIPEDMRWFRKHTLGKTVVMGRRTYESIGKPLAHRRNIVLTSQKREANDVIFTDKAPDSGDFIVIGGQALYERYLPLADRMHLTRVKGFYQGDAYFPSFDENDWQVVVAHQDCKATYTTLTSV